MKYVKLVVKFVTIFRKDGLKAAFIKTRRYLLNKMTFLYHCLPVLPIQYEPPYPINPKCSTDIKCIAYYLPQFHRFPENDAWWGKGFTEWTNVRRSKSMFTGHIQPNVPHEDIGFYNLLDLEVMKKQIAMAKRHGIYGFCFHHYWFSGKRLMEKPVHMFLEHPELDFPFCLNWANENWTRRWDGEDQHILIAQEYSPEDDILFMKDLLPYFADPRYIRIHGRPILQVYHVGMCPDIKGTIERWKTVCRENGEAEPYVILVQSFGNTSPDIHGIDAAVQFPPHLPGRELSYTITCEGLSKLFEGRIQDYSAFAQALIDSYTDRYILYPCVFPAWDNTPRRLYHATIFARSTPEKYQHWLAQACKFSRVVHEKDNRFVFINAWNEWAEGAHLEPTKEYGYAYLNATSRVLEKFALPPSDGVRSPKKILFIGHDAFLAGSQRLLLDTLQWLKRNTQIDCRLLLLLNEGPLLDEYEQTTPLLLRSRQKRLVQLITLQEITTLCDGIPDCILGNTAVAARIYPLLSEWNIPIVTYVHELEASLKKFAGEEAIEALLQYSNHIIATSEPVRQNLISNHGVKTNYCTTIDSYLEPRLYPLSQQEKMQLREALNLPKKGCLFLGCGTKDWRKGIDLFFEVAKKTKKSSSQEKPVFCWLGSGEDASLPPEFYATLSTKIEDVIIINEVLHPGPYFQAADVFLLSSREDPFPLVAIMAALCQTPIVCFADAGGIPEFVACDAGIVVPYEDVSAMSQACLQLIQQPQLREQFGIAGRKKVFEGYTTDVAIPRIIRILQKVIKGKNRYNVRGQALQKNNLRLEEEMCSLNI